MRSLTGTPAPAVERARGMIGNTRPSLARALRMASTRDLSFGLAFLGLAAIVVGCFLPVADAGSVDFDRIHRNTLLSSGIGWLTLLLCGVLLVTLTLSLRHGEATWGPLIGGLLVVTEAVYVGAVELTTCPAGTNFVGVGSACQAASPGLGLFMIGAGGAAMALAGLELAPWRRPLPAASLAVTGTTHRPRPCPARASLAHLARHADRKRRTAGRDAYLAR